MLWRPAPDPVRSSQGIWYHIRSLYVRTLVHGWDQEEGGLLHTSGQQLIGFVISLIKQRVRYKFGT